MIKSGIYKITSPTGRIYIGQSKDLKRRESEYRNNMLKLKSQKRLYNSLQKYGWNTHTFEIIEECEFNDLNCRERYWQEFYDVLNGGLNCILQECGIEKRVFSEEIRKQISDRTKGENNPMYGVDRPTEWRELMSDIMKEKFKNKEDHPNYGNIYEGERLEKIKTMNIGRKASEETKKKMSESHKGVLKDEKWRKKLSVGKLGDKNPMFGRCGKDNVNSKLIMNVINGEIVYGVSELSRLTGINKGVLTNQLNGYSPNNTCYIFLEVVTNFDNYFKNKEIEILNKFTSEELELCRNSPNSYLIENYSKLYKKYKKFNPNRLFNKQP